MVVLRLEAEKILVVRLRLQYFASDKKSKFLIASNTQLYLNLDHIVLVPVLN